MIDVKPGDVWEFDNNSIDSYCIVLILHIIKKTFDHLCDEYEYVVLLTDDVIEWPVGSLQRSQLTMLDRISGAYWRRLG